MPPQARTAGAAGSGGAAEAARESGAGAEVAARQRALLDVTKRGFVQRLHGLDAFAFLFRQYAERIGREAEGGGGGGGEAAARFVADLNELKRGWADAVWTLVERGGRPSRMAGRMFLATAIDAHHRAGARSGSWANSVGLLRVMVSGGTGLGRIAAAMAQAEDGGRPRLVGVGRLLGALPDLDTAPFEAALRPRIDAAMEAEWRAPLLPDFVSSAADPPDGTVADDSGDRDGDSDGGGFGNGAEHLGDILRRRAKRAAFEAAIFGWSAAALAAIEPDLRGDRDAWAAATATAMRRSFGPVATLERAFAHRPLFPLSAASWWANGAFAPTLLILASR
jgi:hypothetical protein